MGRIALLFTLGALGVIAEHRVSQVMPLSGEGGADALLIDSEARRIYVGRANSLLVLDVDSGRQLAEIADLPGIDGIAVAPPINRGYVTGSRGSNVSIFELDKFGHLGGIKVGAIPGAIVYDAFAHRFFTMDRGSGTASAIDADDGEVEETIHLGGRPGRAATDDQGRVFLVLEDTSDLIELDAKGMLLKKRWPLPGCLSPPGIALDRERNRLFIGCGSRRLAIVDAASGKVLSTADTGAGGGDVAVDADTGIVYVANLDGSISLLSELEGAHYKVFETIPTSRGSRRLALDPKTHRLFVLSPGAGYRPVPRTPGKDETNPGPQSSQLIVIE
jgi:DNA-binding beta-propeller fold protein YncE